MGEVADALRRARLDLELPARSGAAARALVALPQPSRPEPESEPEATERAELQLVEVLSPEPAPAAARALPEWLQRLLDRLRARALRMGFAFLVMLFWAVLLFSVFAPQERARATVWLPRAQTAGPALLPFEQLETAVAEVLAPGRLSEIVQRYELYPALRDEAPAKAAARLRADLELEPQLGADPQTGAETWLLAVDYRAEEPELAQAVLRDVADLFTTPGLRFQSQLEAPADAGPSRTRRLALGLALALGVAALVGLRPEKRPSPMPGA